VARVGHGRGDLGSSTGLLRLSWPRSAGAGVVGGARGPRRSLKKSAGRLAVAA